VDPTYLTRGTIYEAFAAPQPIVNDVTPEGSDTPLDAGYTIRITIDTSALVSTSKMEADGSDLRIAYWNGSGWVELDRIVEEINTDHTRVWFQTQDLIDGSDDNYYLYYGNTEASSPPEDWANVCVVGDDFSDGSLTSDLHPSSNGGVTITEIGGELRIEMGTSVSDASIVSTQLPTDRAFTLRHKIRRASSSEDTLYVATIVQNPTQPVVTVNTAFNPTIRIYFYEQLSAGSAQFSMQYRNSSDTRYRWNGSSWVTSSTMAYTGGTANAYYIAEIVSDGDEFALVLRDDSEALLTQTTPIAWADVLSPNNSLWVLWGEPYTSHYYLDARSDFFCLRDYVSPEPSTTLGVEGEPTAVSIASFTAKPGAGKNTFAITIITSVFILALIIGISFLYLLSTVKKSQN